MSTSRGEADAANSNLISSAPAGVVETGVPSFAVLGAYTMGLSTPPTDLHLLPDGQLLAVAQREIAFGDGVRWQVFRAADEAPSIFGRIAVDDSGQIYFGIQGGIARLDLGADSRWRATQVCSLPAGAGMDDSTMISVTRVADDWYWHGGSGAIVAWRPGQTPTLAGTIGSVEQIFSVGEHIFVSEQASGGLYRMTSRRSAMERVAAAAQFASETVTCVVPYRPGVVLVGTSFNGLKLFDGTTLQPFGMPGLTGGGFRINDLCETADGMFAAAVDTVGVVFFDRQGRLVQVLDRSLDHRLARVQKLIYGPGVLWARLNEGFARIEFPSPISRFEPLLASSLAYARPLRHDGWLWLLADGHAMRGIYNSVGRLERFESDGPPGRYVFALSSVGGELFATNETGIFLRRGRSWELIVAGVINARVITTLANGQLLYAARDEIGTLEAANDGFVVHRQSVPQLGDVFNAIQDAAGVFWFELGTSRVARLDVQAGLDIAILGTQDGLTDGWVEAYVLDGVARFHLPNHLFRFDVATHRFVEDRELIARFPQLLVGGGRPVVDGLGRMWFTVDGSAHVLDTRAVGAARVPRAIPVGFAPSDYVVETDGVAWMFLNRRLARVDLRVAPPSEPPLRALVTSVQFPVTNRSLFQPGATLAPLDYTDSSLVFHFVAPANPFGPALQFEVLLEGAENQWRSTGNIGSAAFSQLKAGNYVFRVRPVRAGRATGEEARVAFTIKPPWFRTPLAWTLYGVTGLGLLGFSIWLPAFLQRRENERLERLVAVRTEELNTSNQQLGQQIQETTEKSKALAASEERYRQLAVELEHRVEARTAELSHSNAELQQRESLFRLMFEHAPVGIAWKRADLGNEYHFNPTFRRILQLPVYAPAQLPLIEELAHPDDLPALSRAMRAIQAGQADSFTIEPRFVVAGSQTVWTSLSVAVVRGSDAAIVQVISILEDITPRKKAEQELATTYKNLVDASRMAGMAEVATGVLHNVGNVLNSLNVSTNLVANGIRQAKVDTIVKLSAMLNEQADHLGEFLTQDPKGRLVPEMLAKLAQHSVAERDWLAKEISSMQKHIDHIKDIVAMQQSYATVIGVVESLDASTLFEDALRMNTAALMRHDVTVVREYLPAPKVSVEKGKVLQILINLIRNAKYACDDAQLPEGTQKIMTVRIEPGENGRVRLIVRDNGVGIAPENLTRIFAHGFTTRSYGHGFGLHSSAISAKEMQGSLTAYSEGLGRGATFVLEIPTEPSAPATGTRNPKTVLSAPSPAV
ncbi:ATP-binding protein [Opitutus terrae]|uniref:ATP-binding protein n=1 Tax=Opitutus terrae TaxID=107709 RepID=UPI0011D14DCE|nr:ATP-binding protein [Opitutus terrae]